VSGNRQDKSAFFIDLTVRIWSISMVRVHKMGSESY
jgi:hypothetical protein